MTKQELINYLEAFYELRDERPEYEQWGAEAANAVCEYLESNGHKDIVEKYNNEMMYGNSTNAGKILDKALDELGCEDIPMKLRIFY